MTKLSKEDIQEYKKFYTIEKQEFNFVTQRMANKKHRFYTKDMLPPTYKDILSLERESYSFGAPLGFKQNEISPELKERFAENILLQEEILRVIKKRHKEFNYKCGIIKAKTGIGKSHIVMDIIEYLQTTILVLVSNKKLLQEMIDKFSSMANIIPAKYGDGSKNIDFITVMTKKSFQNCDTSILRDFDCILIDECHQGFTKAFRDKFNETFSGQTIFLYGLSATPSTNELDQCDLEKYYGKIIEIKKDYDFIPGFTFYNYQSKEQYEFEHYAELRGLLSEDKERIKKQFEIIVGNLSKKCSLILCDRISEIEQLEESFNLDIMGNYYLIKITGETKIEDDKENLDQALKSGVPIIIIGSIQKCATGFDFPIIDTIFLFSAIKFENTVIQSVGRALRKSKGKIGAHIHIWNDKILDKQRVQKQNAIGKEYGVTNIKNIRINKERKKKGEVSLII